MKATRELPTLRLAPDPKPKDKPSTDSREHHCKRCKNPITQKRCKFCRVTSELVEAAFEIEGGDGRQAVKRLRAIIKDRIAGHVGWPLPPRPYMEKKDDGN